MIGDPCKRCGRAADSDGFCCAFCREAWTYDEQQRARAHAVFHGYNPRVKRIFGEEPAPPPRPTFTRFYVEPAP